MTDPRFHKRPVAISMARLAMIAGGELADPLHADFMIEGVGTLQQAGPNDLTFLDNPKYRLALEKTQAGACIVHPDLTRQVPKATRVIISRSPYKSYALAAQAFYPEPRPPAGYAATARVHPSARIGNGVVIEDYAIIGENVEIGDDCWIEPHAVVSAGSKIGARCRIGSQASISYALIGDEVRLYPGVRVGQDGFGFAIDPGGYVKVPQLGRVVIEGYSEIGANTTIDRGTLGDTVIGAGTWIDNLVQIGHNVKLGKACILAAQTGISGSTEIGDYVAIGGQAGIAGHLKVGAGARIAAKSGVTRDVPPGEEWMGYPAMPMKQYLRQVATMGRLVNERRSKGNHDD